MNKCMFWNRFLMMRPMGQADSGTRLSSFLPTGICDVSNHCKTSFKEWNRVVNPPVWLQQREGGHFKFRIWVHHTSTNQFLIYPSRLMRTRLRDKDRPQNSSCSVPHLHLLQGEIHPYFFFPFLPRCSRGEAPSHVIRLFNMEVYFF